MKSNSLEFKIIVGLGNPGKKYENTRHNAGWLVVEELVKSSKSKVQSCSLKFKVNKKFNAEVAEFEYGGDKVVLAKPQTFMNESGVAVRKIVQLFNLPVRQAGCSIVQLFNCLWVVHDDLDLELGDIKIIKDRGAGGHHGVESVINHLKSQAFVRFRVGIRTRKKEECILSGRDYVLGEFRGEERKRFEKAIEKCAEAVIFGLKNGIEEAMNKYN